MAVHTFVLTCDHCANEYKDDASGYEDYADSLETRQKRATEEGWYIVFGPERDLGGDGVKAYCSAYCMESDLP